MMKINVKRVVINLLVVCSLVDCKVINDNVNCMFYDPSCAKVSYFPFIWSVSMSV